MKSDGVDEFSPLVVKTRGTIGRDSPFSDTSTVKDTSGRSSKKLGGDSSALLSSQADHSDSRNAPIQTRVEWVHLASFDHFDDDNPKNSDSSNPSQLSATSSPDSDGIHPFHEVGRSVPPEEIIVDKDNPPPGYHPDESNANEDKQGLSTETLECPDRSSKFALIDPSRSPSYTIELSPHRKLLAAARTIHATVRLSRLERARRRAKWAGKKLIVFLLSHIGLTVAVLVYAMFGGFLFRWLEMEDEIDSRNNMMAVRHIYLDHMWLVTDKFNVLHRNNWTLAMRSILMAYERRMRKHISEGTWDGAGENEVNKWTIPGSLLFSTTVITSIGYGDITPRTVAGRLACIPFAIIGIPLTLLCLANLGQLMAVAFKFIWRKMLQLKNMIRNRILKGRLSTDKGDGLQKETHIPILVCVAVIVAYTLCGAAIFSSWETGWTFLDGFYFSFITLSTIGFGDLVPGQHESGTNERRVVVILYLLTGLALLSMVFQLMIDTVMGIFRRYAQIFGLTEEQIERDVVGLDGPVPIQDVVSSHNPDSLPAAFYLDQDVTAHGQIDKNCIRVNADPEKVIIMNPEVKGNFYDDSKAAGGGGETDDEGGKDGGIGIGFAGDVTGFGDDFPVENVRSCDVSTDGISDAKGQTGAPNILISMAEESNHSSSDDDINALIDRDESNRNRNERTMEDIDYGDCFPVASNTAGPGSNGSTNSVPVEKDSGENTVRTTRPLVHEEQSLR